jgi:hypothetical protein
MPLLPENSCCRAVAERIADELSLDNYHRNHEWGMTEAVMGLRAFSEDKFYKELAAWIRVNFAETPVSTPQENLQPQTTDE